MDENKLIKQIKNKDENGLRSFIKGYGGLMKSVISKVLYDFPYLWDEVLNDSILAVWNNISAYQANKSSLKNWCASVAKYRAIDALRLEVKHKTLPLEEINKLDYEDDYNRLLLDQVLNYLSEEDKSLFLAIFHEGKSYEELAKDLNTSKNALYSRVKRGRQKLKKEFQGGK